MQTDYKKYLPEGTTAILFLENDEEKRGEILEYDNKIEDCATDGISYVLYNNVWGTNFPLWYEDNACFSFKIEQQR